MVKKHKTDGKLIFLKNSESELHNSYKKSNLMSSRLWSTWHAEPVLLGEEGPLLEFLLDFRGERGLGISVSVVN